MKKRNVLLRALSLLPLSMALLTGCDPQNSESDKRTFAYTVRYFDDSPTPVQVGYAYVARGEKPLMRKMSDGEAYDFVSHSGNAIPFGKRSVFDKFSGNYDGSQLDEEGNPLTGAIDLNHIYGDCDVYASFRNDDLTYKVAYKNGPVTLDDHKGETFSWGTFPALPNEQETTPEWGYDHSFLGFGLETNAASPINASNYANAKFLHGSGAPASAVLYDQNSDPAAATPGSFYEDTDTYDFYGFTGSWVKIGNFITSTSPKATFHSIFADEIVQFDVAIYSDAAKTTLLGTLSLDYSSSISFDNSLKRITGTKEGSSVSLDVSSLVGDINYWDGFYSDDENVDARYRGQNIADKRHEGQSVPIAAPAYFYPVFF